MLFTHRFQGNFESSLRTGDDMLFIHRFQGNITS